MSKLFRMVSGKERKPQDQRVQRPAPKKEDIDFLLTYAIRRQPPVKGTGDFLHDRIKKWTGEDVIAGCSCRQRIEQMNRWTPKLCLENLSTIVGWLVEEAGKKRERQLLKDGKPLLGEDGKPITKAAWSWWQLATAAPLTTAFTNNPVSRLVIEQMVLGAIADAEQALDDAQKDKSPDNV